jgi:hypothetical protein
MSQNQEKTKKICIFLFFLVFCLHKCEANENNGSELIVESDKDHGKWNAASEKHRHEGNETKTSSTVGYFASFVNFMSLFEILWGMDFDEVL